MAEPRAQYPEHFRRRMLLNKAHKQAATEYVIKNFLASGLKVLLLDGTTSLFLGLQIFEKRIERFSLSTNNVAVAQEYDLWTTDAWPKQFCLDLVGGAINTELMMTLGSESEHAVTEAVQNAQFTIMSPSWMFPISGPAEYDHRTIQVKQAAVRTSHRLIFVMDYTKLSARYCRWVPLLCANPDDWKTLMARTTTFIVTTLPPGLTRTDAVGLGRTLLRSTKGPQTPEEFYAANTSHLRDTIGKRFIEICVR